jgi:chemotaxis protein methyltransferase CheR
MMAERGNSNSSIDLLLDLIHERTGLFYENGRRDLAVDKLAPLMAERGLDMILDYYYLLKYSQEAELEWRRVETALAVNETYFWREFDSIQVVINRIIPQLQQEHPNRSIRIWHAACATGEEPYTMAIALMEANRFSQHPIQLFASDLNSDAVARARAGIYRNRSFRVLPQDILNKYFIPMDQGRYRLMDPIRERVQFFHYNLLEPANPLEMKNLDILFCRNVFIYFSPEAMTRVLKGFYHALREPGYVFVGAAESLLKLDIPFDLIELSGAFGYKKRVE